MWVAHDLSGPIARNGRVLMLGLWRLDEPGAIAVQDPDHDFGPSVKEPQTRTGVSQCRMLHADLSYALKRIT